MTIDKNVINYYTSLFTEDASYSTPFPNLEEACRWSKIGEFLSQIPQPQVHGVEKRLRILDVGCGRGWLTYLANIYGQCDGVDPVAGSVELARKYFPELTFYVGTLTDVLKAQNFKSYDVVITSEVIEHVIDKKGFITELKSCLIPGGHIIVTTPRGEEFKKYLHAGYELQPIEAWSSERELCSLFESHQFVPVGHDRVYINLPNMPFLYQLSMNSKFYRLLNKIGLAWIHKGLQYSTGIYQVWLFQAKLS